jgi:hypothetical protein
MSMSDRAAVVTTAILQIVELTPAAGWRQAIEAYLRDEFHAIATDLLNEKAEQRELAHEKHVEDVQEALDSEFGR